MTFWERGYYVAFCTFCNTFKVKGSVIGAQACTGLSETGQHESGNVLFCLLLSLSLWFGNKMSSGI